MTKEKKTFMNPFSDGFLPHWQTWKDFKKEEFNFEYKGVTSEQMAIKHLVDLSEGDEDKAVKILCQSVRRCWQGFWPLHETTNGNGKSKQPTPKHPEPSLRDQAAAEFSRRNAERQQQSNSDHLKAV